VSTDYVQSLLARGRARAEAEGLAVAFQAADAEALPFADGAFDAAASTFGVMFAPNQDRTATELLRVVRPGGTIGIANWTPASFIGDVFRAIGRHLPPPAGVASPFRWGDRGWLEATFGPQAASVTVETRDFVFRAASAREFLDELRRFYGPIHKAFGALPPEEQAQLEAELLALMARHDRGQGSTLRLPSAYAQAVIAKG
jgi:ubiquinone/menaquinone biosynthesis C-methylase UbiE